MDKAADECEKILKQEYTSTGSFVQINPWIDDIKKHILDIYTRLRLEKKEDKNENVETYEDIFKIKTKEGHPIKRVILDGSAGLGKSTLIDKIAYDWATGSSDILKMYKLVFVLRMNLLEQTSDLINTIFNQLLPEDTAITGPDLKSFIDTNPEKVLILMDGFDEFMTTELDETKFGSILKILNRKLGREYFVVVTTRPSHYPKLVRKSLIVEPFTHVSVLGFNEKDSEKYVHKYYNMYNEPCNKAEGLIEKIQSTNVLSDLSQSPILLLMMCSLWREAPALPETMSHLYNETFKYIFRRRGVPLEEISKIIIAIGKTACDALVFHNQKLTFSESEFETNALKVAKNAGIITEQRVRNSPHMNIQFIHKTFLEFCAAKYCQSLEKGNDEFQKIIKQIANPYDFEYFLRFCCSGNEACTCTRAIVQLLQNASWMASCWGMKLLLNCYYESQLKLSLLSVDFINCILTKKISPFEFSRDHITSFIYFMNQVIDQPEGTGLSYLANVHSMVIMGSNLQRGSADLARCVQKMTNLSTFEIINCSMNVESLKPILSSLTNRINFTHLRIYDEDLGGSGELFSYLKEMEHLQKLDLVSCSLQGNDMEHIAESLSNMPNLAELNLSSNDHFGGLGAQWSYLKEMKHLQKLNLAFSSLQGKDMEHIAESLSNMPNLVELELSGNYIFGGSGASWSHLKEMKHLKKLILADCSLQGEDMEHIAKLLSNITNLAQLDMSSNYTLGGLGAQWSYLKEMEQLQKLDLVSCSLQGNDMEHIAESLSNMPNLVELDMSDNYTLCGSGASWSHLKEMKHLKKLNLTRCLLQVKDMEHIAKSLSNMPNLAELNVSSNDHVAIGGSGAQWSYLKEMKHLQKLNLASCTLQGKDMEHIAESLSNMPNLVELELSDNYIVGGSGASWSPLKEMKHLKKLNLTRCSLQGEDMEELISVTADDKRKIAEITRDMPNLRIIFE